MTEVIRLRLKIERKRREMYEAYNRRCEPGELLEISRVLDKLLNEYEWAKRKAELRSA